MMILASASPRRRELLAALGLEFEVLPAQGEELTPAGGDPRETVKALSAAKALEIARQHPGALVLGADTVVEQNGQILGKPRDAADAAAMLRRLSGASHRVFTGLTLVRGSEILSEAEETLVRFRPLSEDEIAAYVASGEPMDKAGAYGIQALGSLLVEGIEGDYFNVVGLPLCRLGRMLNRFGVRLL